MLILNFCFFFLIAAADRQIPQKDSTETICKTTKTPTMILVVLLLLLLPTISVVAVGMAVDDSDSTIVVLLPPVVSVVAVDAAVALKAVMMAVQPYYQLYL